MSEIPTADWTWMEATANRFEQDWMKGNVPLLEETVRTFFHRICVSYDAEHFVLSAIDVQLSDAVP